MHHILKWARHFAVAGLLAGSAAFAATPGKDFVPVDVPQLTDSGKKVEVLEVFSYACPHCNSLAPAIEAWARKLPPNVVYHRLPISFGRAQWAVVARGYYALEVLNEANRLHEKMFHAIHAEHIDLFSQDTLFDWVEKQGVNRQKFIDAYNSFAVQSMLQRGDQKAMAYGVDSVPTIIIDGKYRTSPSMAGGNTGLFPVMEDLIRQAQKEKGK